MSNRTEMARRLGLQLMPVADIHETDDEAGFAQKVTGLGYKVLEHERADHRLLAVLRELDATPFTNESVDSYKKARLKEVRKASVGFQVCLWILRAMAVGALASIVSPFFTGNGWFLFGSGIALAIVGYVTVSVMETTDGNASWRSEYLERFGERIPKSVLTLATDIKERVPEAAFFVDHLSKKVHPDPFLVVRAGATNYHVAVWDEPDFKGERLA